MLNIVSYDNTGFSLEVKLSPPKINLAWGVDFILMDSSFIMGSKSNNDQKYDNIINIFTNVWNSYEYRLFNGVLF